jgi:hypothetical protein
MFIELKATMEGPDPKTLIVKLKRELQKTMIVFGQRASGNGALGLSRHLKRGKFAPNSEVWSRGGKNGRRVFYDTGAFRNMPTFRVYPSIGDALVMVRVGFIDNRAHPTDRASGSLSVQKLANMLVTGFSFEPNPRQAMMFWSRIDTKKIRRVGVKSSKSGVWTSPPRDFTKHLRSAPVVNMFGHYIDVAAGRVLKEKKKLI